MSRLRELCLSSNLVGANASLVYLFASCMRSSFLCSSAFCRPLTAAQLPICWAKLSSSSLQRTASCLSLSMRRRVLCLMSLMRSSASISSSAFESETYIFCCLAAFSSSLNTSSSPSGWSSSLTTWTMFCWRMSSCWTCFSLASSS